MIENQNGELFENDHVSQTMVPCKKCGGRIFKINISQDLLNEVEKFPFTIITMHVSNDGQRTVHTLVAYVDKTLNCRHVEVLTGKRLFITPYILYNPNLLFLSCNKNLGKFNKNELEREDVI